LLTAVATLFIYPAFSGAGALGAVVVIAGYLWFAGGLMARGRRRRRPSGNNLRGLA